MFSSTSFAEWTKFGSNVKGSTFYLDFARIKINNENIFHWVLRDYLKPDTYGDISSISLQEVDCNIPRKVRKIYATYHTQPMGRGDPSTVSPKTRDWDYPPPNSIGEMITEHVCKHAK